MESVDYLVIGAGVTGLAFANQILSRSPGARVLILEAAEEPGGYCRTVVQDGFVWDYSGHFFHFRDSEIEAWLRQRMAGQRIRTVEKNAVIRYRGRDIDFPFQKNIHQLDKDDFIDCLTSLYFREQQTIDDDGSFSAMLHRQYGRGICERFLVPYNEKLYATSLDRLDRNAMGRFFPQADLDEIIRNMQAADNRSYNATFTYPEGGAVQYIHALTMDLPEGIIALSEPAIAVDASSQTVQTPRRSIQYRHLISSAPLPALADLCSVPSDGDALTSNKVLVFNLGFDRKGPTGIHWMYFPERDVRFYRVGFYDNLFDADRMSLYVEIGASADEELDLERERARVLADLASAGIVDGHQLLSWHSVVLDPAYVHLSKASMAESERLRSALGGANIHSVGRYGRWTYCSIEDNILEARGLADSLS